MVCSLFMMGSDEGRNGLKSPNMVRFNGSLLVKAGRIVGDYTGVSTCPKDGEEFAPLPVLPAVEGQL